MKVVHIISKGHKNYKLMLNLQLGISWEAHFAIRDLKTTIFDLKEKLWTQFPPEGLKLTTTYESALFSWKDYCPAVLRLLMELFQVDPIGCMLAIYGNDSLQDCTHA